MTQAARALGVPQHRLIHLCEKEVVVPEVRPARGRGSSRRFSHRNLFEFAVALELRRLQLPVRVAWAVLRSLRRFEDVTRKTLPAFALPDSLVGTKSVEVSALLVDGTGLYFSVSRTDGRRSLVGGLDIGKANSRSSMKLSPRRLSERDAAHMLSSAKTRTEVNLSAIARDLRWPALPG